MEIKDVTRCAFMAPDPKLMTVDFADLNKKAADHRAEMATLNPPKPEGPALELQRLRRELFNLTERAKSTETYCNNKAGEVKLLEQRLTDALKQKKIAVTSGNALAERYGEHNIAQREQEKADAEVVFQRARRVSAGAAEDLKQWPHRARVEELEKLVA